MPHIGMIFKRYTQQFSYLSFYPFCSLDNSGQRCNFRFGFFYCDPNAKHLGQLIKIKVVDEFNNTPRGVHTAGYNKTGLQIFK